MNHKYKFLITGGAGFIGYHIAKKLAANNFEIILIDDLNDYYDVNLKLNRLGNLGFDISKISEKKTIISIKYKNLAFIKLNIAQKLLLNNIVKKKKINYVINLAAQAGVRFSLNQPQRYIDSNITGFLNILEICKKNQITKLVYASSSSVYGNNNEYPLSLSSKIDSPASLYAVTKITNELMASTYKRLYDINSIGIRFFTVYGPWGRPDMAYYKFTDAAYKGTKIQVFNYGESFRDFTYIDDAITGLESIINRLISSEDSLEIFNIGSNKPIKLLNFIKLIEKVTGKKLFKNNISSQKGDAFKTHADISKSIIELGFHPKTSLESGLNKFINWYKAYNKI